MVEEVGEFLVTVVFAILAIFFYFLKIFTDYKKKIAYDNFTKIVLIAPMLIAAILFIIIFIS